MIDEANDNSVFYKVVKQGDIYNFNKYISKDQEERFMESIFQNIGEITIYDIEKKIKEFGGNL